MNIITPVNAYSDSNSGKLTELPDKISDTVCFLSAY